MVETAARARLPSAPRKSSSWGSFIACTLLLYGLGQQVTASGLQLSEELKQYDGTEAEKPIYLGINGTIFDVSASPSFYGPGGHYHHFTGKDASRAWVTECWDSEDQLTWRMDGLEEMYMPKYLDEQMQNAATGESEIEGAAAYGEEELARMAKLVLDKFGKVSKQILSRQVQDEKEAKQAVHDRLAHWLGFFAGNAKYQEVGTVIKDSDKPAPPKICEAALKKRPLKGGKLDALLKQAGGMGSLSGGQKAPSEEASKPNFAMETNRQEANTKQTPEVEEDLVRDEL